MGVQANDQNQPVGNESEEQEQQINSSTQRPAGQSEGASPDPTTSEVKSLYDDLGIKAPVPTGATKGRPKTAEQEIPILGKQKTMTTKVNLKMHLLQTRMAIQEIRLTRRARKTARKMDRYKMNQAKLTREFATLNPEAKKILSEEAKKTLSTELQEMNQPNMTRKEKRKANRLMKKVLKDQENPTQPSSSDSKS